LRQYWWEVTGTFLKVGALNYGGASVGIIQTEVQEKRGWVSKAQFLEGLALVNTLPGPIWEMGLFFLKVGAFTFGGGLTILAFIQEQVVHYLHWLTPQQFLDGLALGQLTPGPTLILAAFVGYTVGAFWGAVVAVAAVYLPSFLLMLALLPMLERLRRLAWMQAALQGISPAVSGMTAVAVLRMLPAAAPDLLTGGVAVGTVVAMGLWRLSPLPLISGGAAIGFLLRARLL